MWNVKQAAQIAAWINTVLVEDQSSMFWDLVLPKMSFVVISPFEQFFQSKYIAAMSGIGSFFPSFQSKSPDPPLNLYFLSVYFHEVFHILIIKPKKL